MLTALNLSLTRRALASGVMVAGGLGLAAPALASGPVELFAQAVVDPAQPEHMVVLYSNGGTRRGLLFSADAGASWQLLCADGVLAQATSEGMHTSDQVAALRAELRRMEPIAIAAGSATLVATGEGLFHGDSQGCGFRSEGPFAGQRVSGLVPHPMHPEQTFALLGFEGASQGLWQRDADGHWSRFGLAEPPPPSGERVVLKSVLFVPHGAGLRVYQVVWRYTMGAKAGRSALRVSDDGAQTWREMPLNDELDELELLAVDPHDSERVVAVVRRTDNGHGNWLGERDTIFVSDDGGRQFRNYFEVAELRGAVFSDDGSLWLSDAGAQIDGQLREGLFRAPAGLSSPPEARSQTGYHCLTHVPGSRHMYACLGVRFGLLDTDSAAFEVLVKTNSVDSFVTCEGRDVAADCRDQMCQSGYCIQGHFPEAPVCEVYDEPYCGPRAVYREPERDAAAPAPVGPGRVHDPEFDGYDAGIIQISAPPAEKKPHVGCSLAPRPSREGGAGAWAWGLCALWLSRRGVLLRRRVEE